LEFLLLPGPIGVVTPEKVSLSTGGALPEKAEKLFLSTGEALPSSEGCGDRDLERPSELEPYLVVRGDKDTPE
jgi:hypothetical protein